MDRFVIEYFDEGEFLSAQVVESDQRLLNEKDLDVICLGMNRLILFVRDCMRVNEGYYVSDDGRWDYGTREDARNVIKRRL